jgi:hypothetical protein
MFCATIQEFAFSLPTDSGLLRTSVVAGEPIDQAEVLSLTAMAQSLFVTITIESRALDRVRIAFRSGLKPPNCSMRCAIRGSMLIPTIRRLNGSAAGSRIMLSSAKTDACSIASQKATGWPSPAVASPRCELRRQRSRKISRRARLPTSTLLANGSASRKVRIKRSGPAPGRVLQPL